MADRPIRGIEISSSYQGNPRMLAGMEGSTQTFLKGAPLVWSSGYLVEASGDPTLIVGIAAEPGHNITQGSQMVSFYPLSGNVFEANLAQAAADTTSAATNQGVAYGIVARSSGTAHWVVDSADTSSTRCRVLAFAAPSVATDVNARVLVTFFNAVDALTVAG